MIEMGNPRVASQLISPAPQGKDKKKSDKKKKKRSVDEFSAAGGGAISGHMGGDSPGPKKDWH